MSSSSRWRWTVPRRTKYWRSLVAMTSLICLSVRPLLPWNVILSMAILRPSLMVKTTLTSPSPNFSTSGLIWTSK